MTSIQQRIADGLAEAPAWSRSYWQLKATVKQMVKAGDLIYVKPVGSCRANMIALTQQGADKYHPGKRVHIGIRPQQKSKNGRRNVWNRDTVDRLAELVAEGSSLRAAYAELGLSQSTGQRVWAVILHETGEN